MVPRLLVSVRNQVEALIAAQCGVDVIDFKEPDHGPLGMVIPSVLSPAIQALSVQIPSQQISVACGEVTDECPAWAEQLPAVSYLKLGSSGLKNRSRWIETLRQRQEEISAQFQCPVSGPASWIAVAYVDHEAAAAPHPIEIIQAASENSCAGVL
ncbi:MAG TPA: (5-formylfuran-3-yl)methyl phosphate synthase, partial [Planctomicrobium sp.]|nr:(5-formylfuran-3-yl)methyl phosphate synthase [Planctomicrobium sp.]